MNKTMVKTIIVDDEIKSCQTLEKLLLDFCQNVEVLSLCLTVDEAIAAIQQHKPDLVFLDIQMKGETGFDLLTRIKDIDFEIIFATAYSEYAIRAFQFSAIDYLLKPIEIEDLRKSVQRVVQRKNLNIPERIDQLIANLKLTSSKQFKLALPSSDGLVFIQINDIIYCEASGNYTTFFMTNGKKHMVSRTLKEYDELLSENDFFRIHHTYLINLNAIVKYIRGDGGQVIMSNNTVLDVSKRKKESFLQRISH